MAALDLTGQFLIAMPALSDPNFQQTVTFICAHGEDGAMGIVINRPLDLRLAEVLEQMDLRAASPAIADMRVFQGGPVQVDRGFILHSPGAGWRSSLMIDERIGLSTSREALAAIAAGEGPERVLVALGYAGWAAGQLEEELAANAWLSGPADVATIFDLPVASRWRAAAAALGVDLETLSPDVGHA